MANHKSALKRAKQNKVRSMRNKIVKTGIKNIIKKVKLAVSEGDKDAAANTLNVAKSMIDKASTKGTFHSSTSARKISRLSKLVNTL